MIPLKQTNWLLLLGLMISPWAYGQSIVDGFMKGKGNGSVVLSYSWEQYDEFYFADDRRDAPPPWGGQITTQSASLYGTVGLSDDIDIIFNLPYINAQGDGVDTVDQSVGGLQDASLFIKWRPILVETGGGNLSFAAALGVATPFSDYEADQVLSIGNQATRGDLRLLTHFIANSGIFAELQAGYSLRSDDVPNATMLNAKVGYAGANFYLDLWSETQISDSDAPDISEAPFSQTRVNYTQIGATVFVPVASGLGIAANFGQYVSGRNVGLSTRFGAGLVYNFSRQATPTIPNPQ